MVLLICFAVSFLLLNWTLSTSTAGPDTLALFVSIICTTLSSLDLMLIASDSVASETLLVVSFFSTLLFRKLMRHLKVQLLQSSNRGPGIKQLKHNLNFWTCSCRSIAFNGLICSYAQVACCSSLKVPSKLLNLLDSSACEKTLVFDIKKLFLPNFEIVCCNNFWWINALKNTVYLWAFDMPTKKRYCSHLFCVLRGDNFPAVKLKWLFLILGCMCIQVDWT